MKVLLCQLLPIILVDFFKQIIWKYVVIQNSQVYSWKTPILPQPFWPNLCCIKNVHDTRHIYFGPCRSNKMFGERGLSWMFKIKCENPELTIWCNFVFASTQRAQIPQNKEGACPQQRGQAAPDGFHGGAAAAAQGGVPGKPVPNWAAQAVSSAGAPPQWVSDQNLVSEQTGQNQEIMCE